MKETNFESQKNRLDNQIFFEQIKDAVIERLEDLITDPSLKNSGLPLDLGDRIKRNEKVPSSRVVRDAIIGVGESLRLTRDEIDILKEKFLE